MDLYGRLAIAGAVLAIFGVALWALRRAGVARIGGALSMAGNGLSAKRRMKVVERLHLTPQHALCLVRVGRSTLLIATAPSGCSVLDRPETAEDLNT